MQSPSVRCGERISDFVADSVDGSTIATQRFYLRSSLLLIFTHEWPCRLCLDYLTGLDRSASAVQVERCQLLAVVPLGATLRLDWHEGSPPRFPVALAEGNEIHRRYGFVDPRGRPAAAVVLADDTGTVWQVWPEEPEHRLPEPETLLEWVRFVSYQCPECWERPWWQPS